MKYVAITGASAGIGAALAREFASRGCHVGLMARRTDRLQALADELSGQYPQQTFVVQQVDVACLDSVPVAVQAVAKKLGDLDVMVANAGVTAVHRTGKDDIHDEYQVVQVNLLGVMATIDAAASVFRKRGGGQLVAISSIAAFRGIPGSAGYSASKGAVSTYLDTVGMELSRYKIGTTLIHPGFIETELVPGMDRYPFVIPAQKAARIMVDAIAARRQELTVPAWPWRILRPLMRVMPGSVMLKMFR